MHKIALKHLTVLYFKGIGISFVYFVLRVKNNRVFFRKGNCFSLSISPEQNISDDLKRVLNACNGEGESVKSGKKGKMFSFRISLLKNIWKINNQRIERRRERESESLTGASFNIKSWNWAFIAMVNWLKPNHVRTKWKLSSYFPSLLFSLFFFGWQNLCTSSSLLYHWN